MDIADRELVERIERLAFQAGVASRGGTAKDADKDKDTETLLRKLRIIGKAYPDNTGTCIFAPSVENNIEWTEIVAWANKQ